jgi:hypothetical protein
MSTITVLCNEEMTALLAPLDRSKPITGYFSTVYVVAEYDEDALDAVTEGQVEAAKAWWRELGYANIEIRFDEARIRDEGVFGYLSHEFGMTTEKNVAIAFRELADDAGMRYIEFGNWVAENVPTPKQVADRAEAELRAVFGD